MGGREGWGGIPRSRSQVLAGLTVRCLPEAKSGEVAGKFTGLL